MTVEFRINLVTSIILQLVMRECKHKYINVVMSAILVSTLGTLEWDGTKLFKTGGFIIYFVRRI